MRPVLALLALLVCGALSACESTQDKSKKAGNVEVEQEKGVVVKTQNRDIAIVSTKALQDPNGAATVVVVRNKSKQPLTQLPIAINVKGSKGASVFRNDQAGLEPSLAAISALGAGKTFAWVNDQVTPTGKVRSVSARVGKGTPVKGPIPRVTFSSVKLEQDPVSGVEATGFAVNRSKVEQKKLVVFAVARKGRRVVAAGRGQIKRLKSNGRARFAVFFIGNPKGARISLSAPATAVG
jgi:hypothetical protein